SKSIDLPEQNAVFPMASGKSQRRAQSGPRNCDPQWGRFFESKIGQQERRGARVGEMQLGMRSSGNQQVGARGNQNYGNQAQGYAVKRVINLEINGQGADNSEHDQDKCLPPEFIGFSDLSDD